jgi:O-antigen/teichoic acid export membrane protein
MADQMRRMFSLSMYAYLAKILQGLALQAPILIAGATYSAARVGDLKFALTLGGLLLAVSGAINTINIAVFTRAYDRARDGFARRAAGQVALYAIVSGVLGASAGLAAPELVALAGGSRYEHVVGATAVAMVAMALYGVIGVVVSTVHIPSGGYKTFVWVYAVPTVCASGATAVLAGRDASTESIVATVLVGSALGLAWALADMTRRHVGSRHLLGGLVVIAGLGSLPALGLPDAARAALALAVVGAGVLLVRSLRAQEAVA